MEGNTIICKPIILSDFTRSNLVGSLGEKVTAVAIPY
jgi:hypothetical protein